MRTLFFLGVASLLKPLFYPFAPGLVGSALPDNRHRFAYCLTQREVTLTLLAVPDLSCIHYLTLVGLAYPRTSFHLCRRFHLCMFWAVASFSSFPSIFFHGRNPPSFWTPEGTACFLKKKNFF